MKKYWFLTGVAAVLIAAATLLLYKTELVLPIWITWQEREILCPEGQKIVLKDRTVTVFDRGETVWQSDARIRVQDILWCDMDHDEQEELLLLCWKKGRYGRSRPFWEEEKQEKTWSQHIYIYDWTGETMYPLWMASDIGLYVAEWSFDTERRLVITDRQGSRSAWDWVSWGLSSIALRNRLTFGAVGDNLIHEQIYTYALRHFDGCFDDLFAYVQEELSRYDVTSINQETIYVEDPALYGSFPSFGTPIQVGEAVVKAGFDIVTCATNHALDRGVEAIDLTASFYEQNDVICAGIQHSSDKAYRPYEVLEENGIRCAIFSYTQWTNGMEPPKDMPYMLHILEDEQQIRSDLLAAKAEADACVVYVHWGTEYASEADESQRKWAKLFADCGVDVVIGTHPHVLQEVAWVSGENGEETLVYYSLGNFISAQTEDVCRTSGLAYFTLEKEEGEVRVTDHGLKRLYTQWDNGHYTTVLKK